MKGATLELSCSCEKVRGEALDITPKRVNHLVCLCDDCQAYAHRLGQAASILDTYGGSEIFQTTPSRLRLTAGQEHVRCLRLTPRGLARWYAGCCNTPIANSMASAKVPFVGIMKVFARPGAELDAAIGPIAARMQGRFGHGELPPDASRSVRPGYLLFIMGRLALWALRGEHRPHPFFTADGTPIVQPEVLTQDARQSLRSLCASAPA